jgi:hypothetical protein
MAEGWNSRESSPREGASPFRITRDYLNDVYENSLIACNDFIREFCRHTRILYGRSLAERVEYLSLDERSKRLVGVLLQWGYEELLPALDGMSLYRLMDVDFEGFLSYTVLDFSEVISLCTEGDSLDLSEIRVSVDYIYGGLFGSNFQRLVTCLTRSGKGLPEALQEILAHKHGLYSEWGRVATDLEARLNLPRPDLWNFIDTPTAAPDRKVSCVLFLIVAI